MMQSHLYGYLHWKSQYFMKIKPKSIIPHSVKTINGLHFSFKINAIKYYMDKNEIPMVYIRCSWTDIFRGYLYKTQ